MVVNASWRVEERATYSVGRRFPSKLSAIDLNPITGTLTVPGHIAIVTSKFGPVCRIPI